MFKKYVLWSLALVLFAWSCDNDRDLVTISLNSAPTIAAPANGSAFDITEENLADDMAEFTWSAADFGFSAVVTYTLEMAAAGTGFAEPLTVGVVTGETSFTAQNNAVNQLLLTNGFELETDYMLDFRVVSTISQDVEALTSSGITLTINPQPVAIDYPKLNVPGDYQGWDPALDATVIWSVPQDETYDGYVYFADPGALYKFARGSWDENWGDDGNDGSLESGSDNITQAEAGLHRLTVDLNELTHTSTKTDWGLIGDATPGGWDTDTPMTYDISTGLLTVTIDLTAGGNIKFRANNAWDINLGVDAAGAPGLFYNGENIPVAEGGNYTITLDLTQAIYSYTIERN